MPSILTKGASAIFPLVVRVRPGRRVRQDAMDLVAKNGARLLRAARRADCEDGAALVCAFGDMVRDDDVPPETWPLEDVIELLKGADPLRDAAGPDPSRSAGRPRCADPRLGHDGHGRDPARRSDIPP